MKKFLRIIFAIFILIIGILFSIISLLYIPAVQDFVVKKMSVVIASKTNLDLKVEKLRLSFPLDLEVKNVLVTDNVNDSLVTLECFKTNISFWPLLKGEVYTDNIELSGITVNSKKMIKSLEMIGFIDKLLLNTISYKLSDHDFYLDNIELCSSNIDMIVFGSNDTTPKNDTSTVKMKFVINNVSIIDVGYSLEIPVTNFNLNTHIDSLILRNGAIDLSNELYLAEFMKLSNGSFGMKIGDSNPVEGFNPLDFNFEDISIQVDTFRMQQMDILAHINNISFFEKGGFNLDSLYGTFIMNTNDIKVEDLNLITPYTEISTNADFNLEVFDSLRNGNIIIDLDARIGHEDIIYFGASYIPDIEKTLPDKDLFLNIDINGDMEKLDIKNISVQYHDIVKLNIYGFADDLKDIKNSTVEFKYDLNCENLSFLNKMLSDNNSITIPENLFIDGSIYAYNGKYDLNTNINYNKSSVYIEGGIDPYKESFDLSLKTVSLNISQIIDSLRLDDLNLDLTVTGDGFNPMLDNSYLKTTVGISKIKYDNFLFEDISLDAVKNHKDYTLSLKSDDKSALFDINASGLLSDKYFSTALDCEFKSINLHNLGLLKDSVELSVNTHFIAETDFEYIYKLNGDISGIQFKEGNIINKIRSLNIDAGLNKDSVLVKLNSGDFLADIEIESNIKSLIQLSGTFSKFIDQSIKNKDLNLADLKELFPDFIIQMSAGRQNIIHGYLANQGIEFKKFDFTMLNERDAEFRVLSNIDDTQFGTFDLNSTQLNLVLDTAKMDFQLSASNINKDRLKQFKINLDGALCNNELSLNVLQRNGLSQTIFDVGLNLQLDKDSVRLSFDPLNPVIFFSNWNINEDNYISYAFDGLVLANLTLIAEGGMSVSINTKEEDEAKDKIVLDLAISNFNLAKVSQTMPDITPFSGFVNMDMRASVHVDTLNANGQIILSDIVYDKDTIGDLNLNAGYYSAPKDGHTIDARIFYSDKTIAEADVKIADKTNDLNGNIVLDKFPLNLINPFIPQAMASLKGEVNSGINISGSMSNPLIDGGIEIDDGAVHIGYANADYRLDTAAIIIRNSIIDFDDYKIWAYNNNPLTINGDFDMRDFSDMKLDLSIRGSNIELINVKNQKGQMVYGKMNMNVLTTIKGPVNLLNINGRLDLLSGTDITYVMLDSPVSAQNRISNLVDFTSFSDSANYIPTGLKKPAISGIDMIMTISISTGVKLGINLSANGDDRVELIGGGDLAFQMTPMGSMDMTGRYNLNGGFVRYNLPVLPVAKTFNIISGSYVDWSGDLLDPYINITAGEKIRTSVTESDKGTRVVNFEALIHITNKLNDLKIVFDVEAPDDLTIENQLASMTSEERSKQAINLIITQTYTGPGTTAKVNSNNAVNAFIEKEINNFAGSKLKGVDLSFGIDTYDDYNSSGEGGKRTDYSFRFSKNLFNDRFRIVIGGKVSSGQDVTQEDNQAFINDVILEYMLDDSGNRYLKLFHHTGYESLLEGEIVETGLGIVLKRKVRKLKQLFIFNSKRRQRIIENDPEYNKSSK